jgi:Spy/CpxP family protein refolding chaperone
MGHGGDMGYGGGMGHGMQLEALDLTADQKQKIEAVHERATRAGIQARADLEVAQLDLAKLMRADSPDRRAVEAQIDKIGAMRARMQKARVGVMFDTRALLTDAQKKKLHELQQDGPARYKRRGPDGPKQSDQ